VATQRILSVRRPHEAGSINSRLPATSLRSVDCLKKPAEDPQYLCAGSTQNFIGLSLPVSCPLIQDCTLPPADGHGDKTFHRRQAEHSAHLRASEGYLHIARLCGVRGMLNETLYVPAASPGTVCGAFTLYVLCGLQFPRLPTIGMDERSTVLPWAGGANGASSHDFG